MSDSDKIKLPVLPTETMHADLTWLLINPANMATKDQSNSQDLWMKIFRRRPVVWLTGFPRVVRGACR